MRVGAETGPMPPKPRGAWNHQSLEEAREGSSLEPSEGGWPCPHPDCRLPASSKGREPISVVLSPPVRGNWLPWPEETSPGQWGRGGGICNTWTPGVVK